MAGRSKFVVSFLTILKLKIQSKLCNSFQIILKKHVPSFLEIQGHKPVIIYSGQPAKHVLCAIWDHLRNECPGIKQAQERFKLLKENGNQFKLLIFFFKHGCNSD